MYRKSGRHWRAATQFVVLAVAVGACGSPSGATRETATIPPIAPQSARIWLYREFEPSISLNLAEVSLNGAPSAYVPPDGSAVYRDVPPGRYVITVASSSTDVNRHKDVYLGPGQEAFVKILADSSWDSGGDTISYKRDTFYVSFVLPQVARAELEKRPLSGDDFATEMGGLRAILMLALILTAAGRTPATASRVDKRAFKIDGPAMGTASDALNRRLAGRLCPKGFRILDASTRAGGSDRATDNTDRTTLRTIRCI